MEHLRQAEKTTHYQLSCSSHQEEPVVLLSTPNINKAKKRRDTQDNVSQLTETPTDKQRLTDYLNTRLADTALDRASRLLRRRKVIREHYAEKLHSATYELVERLGIEPALFQDLRNAEVLVAIADSWLVNEYHSNTAPYYAERNFLLQATRTLAGEYSKFNQQERDKGATDAGEYITVSDTKLSQEATSDIARFRDNVDSHKTAELMELLCQTGEGSILNSVRQAFQLEREKPYQLLVLKVKDHYRSIPGELSVPSWEELVDIDAAAFVQYNGDEPSPIMVVPSYLVNEILSQDPYFRAQASRIIAHEWAHTQKSMKLGVDYKLGRIWDENMVGKVSHSNGHHDAASLLGRMDHYLIRQTGLSFNNEFNEAIRRPETDPQLYQFIANHFGFRTLLLTMAVQPEAYEEKWGMKQVSGVRLASAYRRWDLYDRVAEEEYEMYSENQAAAFKF